MQVREREERRACGVLIGRHVQALVSADAPTWQASQHVGRLLKRPRLGFRAVLVFLARALAGVDLEQKAEQI